MCTACHSLIQLESQDSGCLVLYGGCLVTPATDDKCTRPDLSRRKCLQEAGRDGEFEQLLGEAESARLEGGALDDACTALQGLVSGVALKDKVLKQACEPARLACS